MKRAGNRRIIKAIAAAVPVAALTLMATSSMASAQTATVERWGSFIGSSSSLRAYEDMSKSPAAVTLPGTVKQVASSNSTNYALLTDGKVYAWGIGDHGELGDGANTNDYGTPVRVKFPKSVRIATLADTSPFDTALAIDTNGKAWGWGYDSFEQLCQGNKNEYSTPVQIPIKGTVNAIAGAGDHALYSANGDVFACGENNGGDLGDGSTAGSSRPVTVTGLQNGKVTSVYASWSDSAALLSGGTLKTWGYNAEGEVGDGHLGVNALTPQKISFSSPVKEITVGGSGRRNGQMLAILDNGTMWAWGNDKSGQLGDDSTTKEASPIALTPPAGVTYTSLDTGATTSYAIDSNHNVWAWGGNAAGEVGNGTTVKQMTPVMVESGIAAMSTTANDVVALPE
jgi:alpha-tubulin suppressor-like RCC1 family protein